MSQLMVLDAVEDEECLAKSNQVHNKTCVTVPNTVFAGMISTKYLI